MKYLEKILRKNKVKPTAMRLLVLQFLINKSTAASLTNIENYFEKSDRTTLYRTLKVFEKNCIVHQINDGTGIPKYALCQHDHHSEKHSDLHLHFHCTRCNETVCLTENQIPQINLPSGFIPEDINVLVKGICDICNT